MLTVIKTTDELSRFSQYCMILIFNQGALSFKAIRYRVNLFYLIDV